MVRPRSLNLPSVLFFYSAFGVGASVGKYEMQTTENVKESHSRAAAQQDTFMTVTLTSQAGGPRSSLFSTCLATSRTFQATFASIEVSQGTEYIRYAPDSFQLRFPVAWKSVAGNYPSILDCANAAYDGDWAMFKYDGVNCKVVNATYGLNDDHECEEDESEVVFILSTAGGACPMPRFEVGVDASGNQICALVNKDLMTFAEAKSFCQNVYPNNELGLLVNNYNPPSVMDFVSKFISFGYTDTNLWVNAEEVTRSPNNWYGTFLNAHYFNGQSPPIIDSTLPLRSAYMDKDVNFKLRAVEQSFKAGALCTTFATSNSGSKK